MNKLRNVTLKDLALNVGNGFVLGQGFAAIGALRYSIFSSRPGDRIRDFGTSFLSKSISTSTEMAQYSLVHPFVDPFFNERTIKNPTLRTMASGAVTGAIIEWRNGIIPMAMSAASGAFQSLFMGTFFSGVGYALRPVQKFISKQQLKRISTKRNAALTSNPIDLMKKAFFK